MLIKYVGLLVGLKISAIPWFSAPSLQQTQLAPTRQRPWLPGPLGPRAQRLGCFGCNGRRFRGVWYCDVIGWLCFQFCFRIIHHWLMSCVLFWMIYVELLIIWLFLFWPSLNGRAASLWIFSLWACSLKVFGCSSKRNRQGDRRFWFLGDTLCLTHCFVYMLH